MPRPRDVQWFFLDEVMMNTPVKLMMTWDIKPGNEKKYFAFISQEFPTILQDAGLQLSDAWYTIYGAWPQISMGFVSEDIQIIKDFLASELWLGLKHRLFAYIQGYQQKIIPARGGFQI